MESLNYKDLIENFSIKIKDKKLLEKLNNALSKLKYENKFELNDVDEYSYFGIKDGHMYASTFHWGTEIGLEILLTIMLVNVIEKRLEEMKLNPGDIIEVSMTGKKYTKAIFLYRHNNKIYALPLNSENKISPELADTGQNIIKLTSWNYLKYKRNE